MMSAGQVYNQNQQNQATGYPPAYSNQQPVGAGQSGPPQFNPVTLPNQPIAPAGGGTTMNVNWSPKNDEMMEGYMWGQFGLQAGGMLNGMVNMLCNYGLANKAMNCQLEIANKYYEVQDNIASYQMDVSLRQMDVQEKAITAQSTMHLEQCMHEERMAKLAGNTQSRLAAIEEKGKTERAKIYSVTDAFSRGSWDFGTPSIAA